jgi:hypothetical protein
LVLGILLCFVLFKFLYSEEQPLAEPSKEIPKVMGLRFGMAAYDVQAEFISNFSKKIDEKENMMAYTGSLLKIDRPIATYIYFKVTPPKDETSWPIKEVSKIITIFDTSTYDATASDLLSRYGDLKMVLIRKYKEPFTQQEFIDPIFDDPELRRVGFETGNAEFSAVWKTTDLIITLQLKGEVPSGVKVYVVGMTKKELTKELSEKKEKTIKEGIIKFTLTYEYLPLSRTETQKTDYGGL